MKWNILSTSVKDTTKIYRSESELVTLANQGGLSFTTRRPVRCKTFPFKSYKHQRKKGAKKDDKLCYLLCVTSFAPLPQHIFVSSFNSLHPLSFFSPIFSSFFSSVHLQCYQYLPAQMIHRNRIRYQILRYLQHDRYAALLSHTHGIKWVEKDRTDIQFTNL